MLHELDLESQGKRYWRKAKAIVHATSMDPRRTSRLNTLNSLGWQAAFRRWTAELATDAVVWMTIAIHTLATLFVFLHHALQKEEQTASKVPQGAPRYWQKRLVPVFEFGAMHALLLQMAILPIVMCSNLLTALRRTPLGVLLPLASSTAFHQHLGAVMAIHEPNRKGVKHMLRTKIPCTCCAYSMLATCARGWNLDAPSVCFAGPLTYCRSAFFPTNIYKPRRSSVH